MQRTNQCNQPIGPDMTAWQACQLPSAHNIAGKYCRLERLDATQHARSLYAAITAAGDDTPLWTYMGDGPCASVEAYISWVTTSSASEDPIYYAIIDQQTGTALGHASYLRMAPEMGSIEVGNILFTAALQKTRAAPETMYLMMKHAFDLGYRRYEWKCDDLNEPSRAAAARLGFVYEGTFRQAVVYKNRSRDTAWFSIIDEQWPSCKQGYEQWLHDDNFDEQGRQRQRFQDYMPA